MTVRCQPPDSLVIPRRGDGNRMPDNRLKNADPQIAQICADVPDSGCEVGQTSICANLRNLRIVSSGLLMKCWAASALGTGCRAAPQKRRSRALGIGVRLSKNVHEDVAWASRPRVPRASRPWQPRQSRGETPLRLTGRMPVLRAKPIFIHVLRPSLFFRTGAVGRTMQEIET